MDKQLIVKNNITIKAPASKVWEILTNPENTKKYMFGCEVISDWKVGHKIDWKGKMDGKDIIYVTGNIVGIEHGKYLAYSTFDPNGTLKDIPENYLIVTVHLSARNGETVLTISQGDFAIVEDGEERYNHTVKGWEMVLLAIKELAEAK